MIEAKGLTKKYGNFRALDKVSFEVRKGEVVGFLGPNGAGKSTTMRILTCYLSASSGTAKVHGHDVFDAPLEVRSKIGYLPQRATMYGEMSVWDYLEFVAELREIPAANFRKRMKDVVEVCGLSRVLGKDIGTLSHGYRQRVGLGQALIHDPPILILDEPTSDLDPNERAEVIDYIQEIGQDRTVILSTHNLAEVEAACARAIIISKGRVVADGGLDDVRARGGRVRYEVVIDETEGLRNGAPNAKEVLEALTAIEGVTSVKEKPTDESTHAFTIMGTKSTDLRGELFRLMVDKGWILLEMSRDVQKLEDVFKTLTRGEELLDRGRSATELDGEDFDDDDLDEEDSVDDDDEDLDEEDSVADDEDDDEGDDDDDLDDDDDDEDKD